jgi:hypothetical protein
MSNVSRQVVGVVGPYGDRFGGEIVTLILFGTWNPSLEQAPPKKPSARQLVRDER